MKDYQKEHELMRRQVWIEAWTSTANANDCKNPSMATTWADKALEAFDNRFEQFED